ncbi:hypothetical protein VTO42DRAFT_8849 [Malbranchea cinnamomea]
MPDDSLKRLHITPLNPTLLETILNPSVRSLATDISFHSIQTFPENNYGYVTLPTAEADKLVKKLNGSILKGRKFKIQEAVPKRRFGGSHSEADADAKPTQKDKPSKRLKTEGDTLPGFELPSGRHVKRGWTEERTHKRDRKGDKSKAKPEEKKRKSQRSKYTDHQECLFRTVPPPNKWAIDEKGGKSGKRGKLAQGGIVVHEFSHTTTHPTFIRSGDSFSPLTMTSEFVEGLGWVDRAGNVKEPAIFSTNREQRALPPQLSATSNKIDNNQNTTRARRSASLNGSGRDWTSDSSPGVGDKTDSEVHPGENSPPMSPVSKNISEASPASSDAEDDHMRATDSKDHRKHVEAGERREEDLESAEQQLIQTNSTTTENQNPSAPKLDQPKIDTTEVHPLEALFKRPAPSSISTSNPVQAKTQFSFFGNDDHDTEEDDDNYDGQNDIIQHNNEPQTPFTKLDMQSRALRSGAPTPETAAVTRTKLWGADSESSGSNTNPRRKSAANKQPQIEESEFAKWFWENRGDNNRAWKRRRREAAKEKRQKENRMRGVRAR